MVTYLFVNALIHDILIFVLALETLRNSYNILFKKLYFSKTFHLSPIFAIYFVDAFLIAFMYFILSIYLITFWRPNMVIYDARIIYILSIIIYSLSLINSLFTIGLCIDRCLTVVFGLQFDIRHKSILAVIVLILCIIFLPIYIVINNMVANIPTEATTNCLHYTCIIIQSKYQTNYILLIKTILSCTDIFGCCVLFLLLKLKFSKCSKPVKQMTKTVILMIFINALTEFLPSVINGIIFSVFNIRLMDYIGPHVVTLMLVGVTICTRLYSKAIKKQYQTFQAVSPLNIRIFSTIPQETRFL